MQSVINLEFDDTPPLPSTFAVWFAGVVCFRSGVFFVSTISFVRIVVFALTLRTLLSWVELIGSVCEQHNLFLATLTHCHIYLRVLTTYQTDIAVISKESQAVHTRHPSHKHASKHNIAFYMRNGAGSSNYRRRSISTPSAGACPRAGTCVYSHRGSNGSVAQR